MQLRQLTALENDKIFSEYKEVRDEIAEYERILSSEANIIELIRQDMLEMKKRFPDKRRTEIIEHAGDVSMEDLIADEMNVVTISQAGYIKRMPLAEYRTQGRGGKGVTGAQTKEGTSSKALRRKQPRVHSVLHQPRPVPLAEGLRHPAMGETAQGRAIINCCRSSRTNASPAACRCGRSTNRGLFMVTRRGVVKKTALVAYSRPKQGGIIGISLNEGDELFEVLLTGPGDHVIHAHKNGMGDPLRRKARPETWAATRPA